MLTSSFRTAKELGISEDVFMYLQKVLVALEMGEIKKGTIEEGPGGTDGWGWVRHPPTKTTFLFDMGKWGRVYTHTDGSAEFCGCIYGIAEAMALLDGKQLMISAAITKNLDRLFFGVGYVGDISSITAEHAAEQLRVYLTGGVPNYAM